MITFLIILVLSSLLIGGGIMFNLYLYSQGAFRRKHFRHAQKVQTAAAGQEGTLEEYFFGITDDATSHYVRNGILIFFASIAAVIGVLIFFLNSVLQ